MATIEARPARAGRRWFETHTRAGEVLSAITLVNGHLCLQHGAVIVSNDEAKLGDLCAEHRVAARSIDPQTFIEGVRVHRV